MDIKLVAPEIRRSIARFGTPPLQRRSAQRLLKLADRLVPAVATPGTVVEELRNRAITARVIRPMVSGPSPGGAVLWFHGGGFVFGTTRQDAALLGRTAVELGIPTVSVDYPLAPAAKVVDMVETGYRAWTWLTEHAGDLGIRADRIVIGGESAGAQIAAVLAQYIHDRGGPQPAGAWLFAPGTDDRIAASNPEEARRPGSHFIIDRKTYLELVPEFSGHAAGSAEMPDYVFPNRRKDLSGLPPTWLYCGSIELFREEIGVYAERLKAAGVPTELVVIDGAVHAFEVLAPRTKLAQHLFTQAIAWLRGIVGRPGQGAEISPAATSS